MPHGFFSLFRLKGIPGMRSGSFIVLYLLQVHKGLGSGCLDILDFKMLSNFSLGSVVGLLPSLHKGCVANYRLERK